MEDILKEKNNLTNTFGSSNQNYLAIDSMNLNTKNQRGREGGRDPCTNVKKITF